MRAGWECLVVLAAVCGCAGDLKNPERFSFLLDSGTQSDSQSAEPVDVTPPPCLSELFEASCGKPGCHAMGSAQVDLVSPDVASRLIGQMSSTTQCKGRVLVADDGSASLLLQKVQGNPPCGLPMPLGDKLSSDDLACISNWVETVSHSKGGGN